MKRVLTFGRYLKQKYHKKVYKIPVSIPNFTCPNIDGTVAKGGCTYCDNESFSPNLQSNYKTLKNSQKEAILNMQLASLELQIKKSSAFLKEQKNAKAFIVYFQSFTNTYAPITTLKALYELALSQKDVIGLSIGTRVDCVDDEILGYLKELSKTKEIWIEYGVQSVHNQTLKKINRGHLSDKLEYWIPYTKSLGLNVCAHLIFGLYNETKEMMLESVKKCIDWNVDSFKFHPLYIVKNTKMALELQNSVFRVLTLDEYLDILCDSVKMLPKNVIIQRVSAGIDNEMLLAPSWCKNKNSLISSIKKHLYWHGIVL